MGALVLAIDAGTSNLRVCVFNLDGQLLGQTTVPVVTRAPAPGLVEQDADAIWRATQTAIGRTLARIGRTAQDLACIGVTSQRTSAVLWDRTTGETLTPLVVWSDLRGVQRARALNREAGTASTILLWVRNRPAPRSRRNRPRPSWRAWWLPARTSRRPAWPSAISIPS